MMFKSLILSLILSLGSVPISIVETKDRNVRGYHLLLLNRKLGYFVVCIIKRNPINPWPLWSCGSLQGQHAWYMQRYNQQPKDKTKPRTKPGTFGLAKECSTTEIPLLPSPRMHEKIQYMLHVHFSRTLGAHMPEAISILKWQCTIKHHT